jgi:hypothetical protein
MIHVATNTAARASLANFIVTFLGLLSLVRDRPFRFYSPQMQKKPGAYNSAGLSLVERDCDLSRSGGFDEPSRHHGGR